MEGSRRRRYLPGRKQPGSHLPTLHWTAASHWTHPPALSLSRPGLERRIATAPEGENQAQPRETVDPGLC